MTKQKILLTVFLAGILTVAGCADDRDTTEEAVKETKNSVEISMDEIAAANRKNEILRIKDNVLLEGKDSIQYIDNEKYYEDINGKKMIFSEDYSYVDSAGQESTWLEFNDEKLVYDDFDNLYFSEEFIPHETVISCQEKNGDLHIKTKISKEDVQEFGFNLKEFEEGQYFESEYVVDPENYLLKKVVNRKCMDGRKSVVVRELNIKYNVEEPEKVKEIYTVMKNDEKMRNITVVLNPGSVTEQTFCRRVEKGHEIYMDLPDDYYEMYVDKEMTQNFTGDIDKNSDLQLYTRKLLRVNC